MKVTSFFRRRLAARLPAGWLACLAATGLASGAPQGPEVRFRGLAAQLVEQRLAGGEEKESAQEEALLLLDEIVLRALNTTPRPSLAEIDSRLAALVTREPAAGESYRLVLVGAEGVDGPFALVVNLALSGPSAVRLYARTTGRFQRVARIDRFTHPDFFDEYLEVVPADGAPGVFVTVTGRTDDLATGIFTAWQFDGAQLRAVWASDLVQQSRYEPAPKGIRLTYCAQTDEARPRVCRKMVQERYEWDGTAWRRAERADAPLPK